MTIEREFKLAADLDFVLPALIDGAVVAGAPAHVVSLDATYYDTSSLALARSGVTLRSRTGEAGPAWTLKVPLSSDGAMMQRREIEFDAPIDAVPAEAQAMVRAHTRSAALRAVAQVHTERTQLLLEASGRTVAVLVDDVVSATSPAPRSGGAVVPIAGARRFREIEIEVAHGVDPDVLDAVRRSLRDAGCRDDEPVVPKAVRALGSAAEAPPDVVVRPLRRGASLAEVVSQAVARSVEKLIEHHPGVVLGDDPESVHQFRVAARRLRSDLRTFDPLLDPSWSASLRSELSWLGAQAGSVRDNDVLRARLLGRIDRLPAQDAWKAARLLDRLADQAGQARDGFLVALGSDRYVSLLDSLVDAAQAVRFRDDMGSVGDRHARHEVVALVRKPWRQLLHAFDDLGREPSDDELHAVRIRAKRARYALEAIAPVAGAKAKRLAGAISNVQDVLGDHHDTIVAETWLRDASNALLSARTVGGMLIAFEWQDRAATRRRLAKVWDRASVRDLARWLR
jgi:CHAD domain-containing protein